MSYKSRVQGAAQEILFCRVKDLNGPATKMVSMAYETYLPLKKEMEIEIISIIQAGKPAAYKGRLESLTGQDAKLPSQRGTFPMHGSAKKPSQKGNKKPAGTTYLPEDVSAGQIPEPPAQNKQRLPGEEKGAFHARRMHEGKAYKKWEKEYGEAYARARSAESVAASGTARNVTEGEDPQVSGSEAGAPGNEATDLDDAGGNQVPDPIKEAIERASHEQLGDV